LATADSVSRYFFDEPKYFPQRLLDNSSMLTFRMTQIKYDPGEEVHAIGVNDDSVSVKFWIKPFNSSTEESKTPIFSPFNMSIYGDNATVAAWRFFYKHRLNFQYDVDDVNGNKLFWDPGGDVVLFSLNRAAYLLKMEVES
jgi:hypothetical protein